MPRGSLLASKLPFFPYIPLILPILFYIAATIHAITQKIAA